MFETESSDEEIPPRVKYAHLTQAEQFIQDDDFFSDKESK
jgi:hypothetical protein